MRALLVGLALLAAGLPLLPAAGAEHCIPDIPPCALGQVRCDRPEAPFVLCHEAWAQADPGYCLRQQYWDACVKEQAHVTCTLDMPPSRCGNDIVGFGFHRA